MAAIVISTALSDAIYETWQEISADAEVSSNADAIELCIDADRMTSNCGAEGEAADKELDELIKVHGISKVIKALCKAVDLV